MSEKAPIIVVLGIDVDGRAHGSRFEERDAPFVQRAAELMGFHAVRVPADNDELHAIAEKLPLGKIFATGRAFVPFVSRSALDKLAPRCRAAPPRHRLTSPVKREPRPRREAGHPLGDRRHAAQAPTTPAT